MSAILVVRTARNMKLVKKISHTSFHSYKVTIDCAS